MGKKKSKTKTVNTPWAPMQPYILGAASDMSGIVKQNQPQLEGMASDLRGMLPQFKQLAFGGNPALTAGMGYATDVLGGKYLGGNPYLEGIVHQGEQDAGNAVNSSFSMHGRTGGGNNIERLAKGVALAGNQLRYADYDTERNRMASAMGMVPGLTSAQFAGIPAYLGAVETAGNLPYAGVGALAPLLAQGAGAGTSNTTEKKGWGQMMLDAAAAAAQAAAASSDRRLKKNIVKVGEAKDGLGIYEWEYKNDPDNVRYRGVMADEVKELRPQAYIPNFRGDYAGVNYAVLGDMS